MPLMPVLADIERAGILIDGPALAVRSRHIEQELARYTARIYELAGEEFNINSPPQLGRILFEKLDLPSAKKTGKTRSFSTAAEVLEELALTHELPRLVLEWRALHKLKSTYIDALPVMVRPEDRPRAYELQPGGRRNRTLEQLGSEPAEHSRSAPSSVARSGARSSPRRATC